MPVNRFPAMLVAAALTCVSSVVRAEPPLPSGLFQIGGTGIMCVKDPCPRIGVMAIRHDGVRLPRPVFSGPFPIRVEGGDEAREAVRRRWTVKGCLIVDGALLQPGVLRIDRIIGDCAR